MKKIAVFLLFISSILSPWQFARTADGPDGQVPPAHNSAKGSGPAPIHASRSEIDATVAGNLQGLRESLSDPDAVEERSQRSLLMLAAGNGRVEVVKFLVERGADINAQDADGRTALIWACGTKLLIPETGVVMNPDFKSIIECLLKEGADPNLGSNDGMTALLHAAAKGFTEAVDLLLASGADLSATTKAGWTPLMIASQYGRTGTVQFLLQKPVALESRDKDGLTALMLATLEQHPETAKLLIAAGADVNIASRHGATPLIVSAILGNEDITRLLLDHGADTTVKTANGLTALDFAERDGHLDVVALLTAGERSRQRHSGDVRANEARWHVSDLLEAGGTALAAQRYAEAANLLAPVLEQVKERYGGESLEWSYSAAKLANAFFNLGDFAAAKPLYERTLDIHEQQLGLDHRDTAFSRNSLAVLLDRMGYLASARPLYEQALIVIESQFGPYHPYTATGLSNLASVLQKLGEYDTARSLYVRALTITEARFGPDDLLTATSLNNLASLLQEQGKFDAARPLHERALAIREQQLGPDHPDTALGLRYLAALHHAMGDYAAAQPLYERALTILEQQLGRDHLDTARDVSDLAVLLDDMGKYAAAKPLHERALAIFEQQLGPDHPAVASSLNNLAWLFGETGDYAAAQPLYERALTIREQQLGDDHPETAASLNNLGLLLQAMDDHVAARPLHERALAIAERKLGFDHPQTAIYINNLSLLLSALGDHPAALSLAERALAIAEMQLGSNHPQTAASLVNVAEMSIASGRGSRRIARERFQRAAAIYEVSGAKGLLWRPLSRLGMLAEGDQDWSTAADYYRMSIVALEEVRSSLDPEKTQTTFMRDKQWVYEALQRVLYLLHKRNPGAGHDREMFAVAERGRARALLDLLGEARWNLRQQAPSDWQVRYTEAMAAFNGAQKALATDLSDADRDVQLTRLQDAEAEMGRLDLELRRIAPALASLEAPQPVRVEALQRGLLEAEEVLLAYALGDEQSFLYVVSREQFMALELPPQREIRQLVESLGITGTGTRGVGGLSRRQPDVRSLTGTVSDILLAPVAHMIPPNRRLIIVPDGILFYVPFELLGNVLEEHAISYQPSASILAFSRQHATAPQSTSGLLAMAPFAGEHVAPTASRNLTLFTRVDWLQPEPLPFTLTELKSIEKLYGNEQASLRFGAAAQEAVLKSPEARNYRTIHLATHAFANPVAPRRSSVVLSQENLGPDEDGLLTLYELFSLKLDSELVVLSACETGLGKLEKGEGMIGLTRGFLYAGTRSLVVSLWKVSDQATAIFMERFYRNMRENGMSKAEALRQAKLSFVNEEEMRALRDPFYWAPFVLVGDPD